MRILTGKETETQNVSILQNGKWIDPILSVRPCALNSREYTFLNKITICGDVESAKHFLLEGLRFQEMCLDMTNIISTISEPSLNIIW